MARAAGSLLGGSPNSPNGHTAVKLLSRPSQNEEDAGEKASTSTNTAAPRPTRVFITAFGRALHARKLQDPEGFAAEMERTLQESLVPKEPTLNSKGPVKRTLALKRKARAASEKLREEEEDMDTVNAPPKKRLRPSTAANASSLPSASQLPAGQLISKNLWAKRPSNDDSLEVDELDTDDEPEPELPRGVGESASQPIELEDSDQET